MKRRTSLVFDAQIAPTQMLILGKCLTNTLLTRLCILLQENKNCASYPYPYPVILKCVGAC